ncbi:MAG: fibronectin type III domain-containing protein [Gammaproteobacteria bacterium]|nr:fibronectin type III domain-containing protein [Gammaproteobacteria bacterium]
MWSWDGGWKIIANDTPTYFNHTDFVPGTQYWYTVRATNDRGEVSGWSDYVSATGPIAPTATPTSATTSVLTAQPAAVAVELSWTEVAGAARYELLTWWDAAVGWQDVGGNSLAGTTYTHTGLTVGTKYYYAIRGLDAAGDAVGEWSDFAFAIPLPVLHTKISRPPSSVESDRDFQIQSDYHDVTFTKYLKTDGVHVVATDDVPDLTLEQTAEIIAGMLSDRPDLVEAMDGYNSIAFIIPGLRGGSAAWTFIKVRAQDPQCLTTIHETAHMIHMTIEGAHRGINWPPSGTPFDRRLRAAYQNALAMELWTNLYASSNFHEYWSETVTFYLHDHWFRTAKNSNFPSSEATTLEEYDPNVAVLIEETLGDASVPAYCLH